MRTVKATDVRPTEPTRPAPKFVTLADLVREAQRAKEKKPCP
jgi:hypothetical protein